MDEVGLAPSLIVGLENVGHVKSRFFSAIETIEGLESASFLILFRVWTAYGRFLNDGSTVTVSPTP